MRAPRFARLWVLALALPGLGAAHAGTISGQFVLGGKAVPVHEVAAFRVRDQNNPRSVETYIMLTAKPVDRAAIGAAIDPYRVAINDRPVHDDDYLAFSVRANGETSVNAHVGGTQYLDTSGSILGQPGSLTATCRENATSQRFLFWASDSYPGSAMLIFPLRFLSCASDSSVGSAILILVLRFFQRPSDSYFGSAILISSRRSFQRAGDSSLAAAILLAARRFFQRLSDRSPRRWKNR
jgi:hypothetical protein